MSKAISYAKLDAVKEESYSESYGQQDENVPQDSSLVTPMVQHQTKPKKNLQKKSMFAYHQNQINQYSK